MPFDEFASGVTTLTGIRKPAAGDDVFSSGVDGDAQDRFVIDADGTHHWGSGAAAPDLNLYRFNSDTLRTDKNLTTGQNLVVYEGASTKLKLGDIGPGAGVVFGAASDTNLYRSAADTLKTDDSFEVGGATLMIGPSGTIIRQSGNNAQVNVRGTAGDNAFFCVRHENTGAIALTVVPGAPQKIGFFGAAAAAQPAGIADPGAPGAIYSQAEATAVRDAVVSLITRLETLGLIATV